MSYRLTRRSLIRGLTIAAGAAVVPILAACGAAPSPTAAPAKPTEAPKPAAAAPTTAPAAPTKPVAAPTQAPAAAATTAPAAPTKPAEPTKPAAAAPAATPQIKDVVSGKFNVWFSANWNTVTDEAVGKTFVDWGKEQGIQVEWQSIPGSPQQLIKETAALAAGAPPELNNANGIYWYTQGEYADLTSLVGKFKDKAGGLLPISVSSLTAPDGKVYAAPYAIDCWPAHWRKDVIEPVTGGGFFKTWDDLLTVGPKIQQPPRTFAFAMALGHEGDHVNNIVTVLWDYGGRLNDENGKPDIINPANKAGIEMIVKMWQAKLIPPETLAQTVTSWNNETYQKARGMIAINPATIFGWLLVNDKDLASKTGLAPTPKGPAGSFAEGGAIGFSMFKKAKLAEKSPSALEYFMQPDKIQAISKSVEGRFVPIYKDHTNTEFWNSSAFAEMKNIANTGRVRNWPAPPQPWLSDVQDAKYTLSDMMQKIFNDNMPIEKAQEWAQGEMTDSYNKFSKK